MSWFAEFSTLDRGFAISSLLGAVLLALRLVLMFVGGDGDADVDIGDDVGFDDFDATDASFRVLSLQGLMAFFLMFGLVGLALSREAQFSGVVSFSGAMAAGIISMVLIGLIYLFFERMQSSGNINMQSAIGREGTVYLGIPAHGTGQVQVAIQGRLRVEDALADGGQPLPTGTPVRVTGLRGNQTLVVAPVDNPLPDSHADSPTTTKE